MKLQHMLKCGSAFLIGGTLVYVHKDKIMQCCDKIRQLSTDTFCNNKCKLPTIVLLCDTSRNNCECTDKNQNQAGGQNCNCTEQNCCCSKEECCSVFNEFCNNAQNTVIDINSASPCLQAKFKNYTERFELEYLPSILLIDDNDKLIAKLTAPSDINTVRSFIRDNIG